MKKEISAMRFAGIGCGVMLAVIAYYVFTTPSEDFVGFLTKLGNLLGGGTTYGVLALSAFPPLVGCICYFIWKWAKK